MNATLAKAEQLIRRGITKIDLNEELGMSAEHLRSTLVYKYNIRDLPPFKRVQPKKKPKLRLKKKCGIDGCKRDIPINDIGCEVHYSIILIGRKPEPDHLWTSEVYQ